MKKLYILMFALVLASALGLCACDSGTSFVENIEKDEQGLVYEETDGKYYEVTDLLSETEVDIVIPSTYKGKPVKAIGNHAFNFCRNLRRVTVSDGIISIGNNAFFRSSVQTITLPDSVTEIGEAAFGQCWSLISITLPNGITSIDGICYDCFNLVSVTIPDGVKSINHAFEGCKSLQSAVIPSSVTTMEKAFNKCTYLTSIIIPESVNRIYGAFKECERLTIYCEAASKPDGWEDDWNSGRPAVWDCKNNEVADDGNIYAEIGALRYALRDESATVVGGRNTVSGNLIVPKTITYKDKEYTVTAFGSLAFADNREMKSITIPDSVVWFSDSAFDNCKGLESMIFNGTQEQWDKLEQYYGWIGVGKVTISCTG